MKRKEQNKNLQEYINKYNWLWEDNSQLIIKNKIKRSKIK